MKINVTYNITDDLIVQKLRTGIFDNVVKEHIRDFGEIQYIDNDIENKIQIGWHIYDVKTMRPDLTDEQAREVLDEVDHRHDANYGICWDTLKIHADYMFPRETS